MSSDDEKSNSPTTHIGSTSDDMDIETDAHESRLTHRPSTESMAISELDLQLDPDDTILDRQRERQRLEEQEFRKLQERRVTPWQRRLQHAARLENIAATIPPWLPRHRYLYEETRNECCLDETFSDTSQQSPPDSVVESYELDKLDPRERWEQEQINALESAAAAEELMTLEHQERQQRRDTDVDMDSGTE